MRSVHQLGSTTVNVTQNADSSGSSNTSAALVGFLSDPATIAGLAAIAVGTAWYLSSRAPAPVKPPVAVDNQSLELTVINIESVVLY